MRKILNSHALIPPSGAVFARIHDVIRAIPSGKVKTYGEVAAQARVSARTVVWALHQCPHDVPWHRVLGKQRRILLARRSPLLAAEQAHRLSAEGWRVRDWKLSRKGKKL